jgi:hypothetical protein
MGNKFAAFNLTGNVPWETIKRDDLFFDPQREQIFHGGFYTGWDIIYRDSGDFIAIRSKNFELVKNKELNNIIESYGSLKFKLNLDLSGNLGSRKFNLVYDADKQGILESGDSMLNELKLEPKFVVSNAYDGGASLKFQFGFFRHICSNLLVIPVEGKVFSKTIKHKRGLFDPTLSKQVNDFLDSASIRNFKILRDKIEKANLNKSLQLPFNFFVNLPTDLVYLYLAVIVTHSECKVEVITNEKGFFPDIRNLESAKKLLVMVLEARKKKFKLKGDATANWDLFNQIKALEYSEKVNTCWDIYNLLIKSTQVLIKEHNRRMRLTSYVGNYLL